MRALLADGQSRRGALLSGALISGSTSILASAVLTRAAIGQIVLALAAALLVLATYRSLLAWHSLLAATILVILLIPIRRYSLPGSLPFTLEPYRILVGLVAGGWVTSLLIDRRVRLRRSGLEAPLAAVAIAAFVSVAVNSDRIIEYDVSAFATKKLSFLLSYLVVFYMIVSLVREERHRDFLLKTAVGGGAVVAAFALVEARTHYNFFDHLQGKIPFLRFYVDPTQVFALDRGGSLRATASAQHPIALGAALYVLLPIALYLVYRTGQRRWILASALLACAGIASISRTSMIMLIVAAIVFVRHRGRVVSRYWPALIVMLAVVHVAAPGALGSLKESFFPHGGLSGLISEQERSAGSKGSGRVADLGPSLHEFGQHPVFGEGYGTRVVEGDHTNAFILDDEWLTTLLETGLAGALAWFWVFASAIRRLGRAARADSTARGWLLTAIESSILAFAVGMFFYDAFSFIQVTFLMFILLALGSTVLLEGETASDRARPAGAG